MIKSKLLILFYTFLSISWTIYFIQFCMGIDIGNFLIGCSLFASALTCMKWLKDEIMELKRSNHYELWSINEKREVNKCLSIKNKRSELEDDIKKYYNVA